MTNLSITETKSLNQSNKSSTNPLVYSKLCRVSLHLSCLFMVVFLTIYSMAVCPFLDTVSPFKVVSVLLYVGLIQILYREFLLNLYVFTKKKSSLRSRYYAAILVSWFLAGITASILHYFLYEEFPIASHLKVLVGYWALGGGFAALVESLYFNSRVRKYEKFHLYQTSFSMQFLVFFSIFMIVPSLVLVLMTFRFAYEGYIDIGAGYEMIFLVTVFTLFAIGVGYYYGHSLRDDTKSLLKALNMIDKGNYDILIDDSRGDELGFVAKQVNDMAKAMILKRKVENAFGRFVDPKLVEMFTNDLADEDTFFKKGRVKNVSIIMCDLRDFTNISETMDPTSVVDMLNNYFSVLVDVIDKNNGIIDKFIGDAVLAVFGLVDDKSDHELDAINAAKQIRDSLKKINKFNIAKKYPVLDNGIGIHSGEVLAGYLGSKSRLEYTIIGANVNLVSRIQDLAKGDAPRVLISEPLGKNLKSKGLDLKSFKEVSVKGVSNSFRLYYI